MGAAKIGVAAVAMAGVVAAPAHADAFHSHIKALKVASIAISDQSCQRINVTVRTTRGVGVVETDAHRHGVVASLRIPVSGGVGHDYLRWCVDAPLGRYRMGPSQLCGYDSLGSYYCSGTDKTVTTFFVRRFARIDASRSGGTVSGRLSAYSLTKRTYTGVRGVRVKIHGDSARTGQGGRFTLHGSGSTVRSVATATVAAASKRV